MKLKTNKDFQNWYEEFKNKTVKKYDVNVKEGMQMAYEEGQRNPIVPQHIKEATQALEEIEQKDKPKAKESSDKSKEPEVQDINEAIQNILSKFGVTGIEVVEANVEDMPPRFIQALEQKQKAEDEFEQKVKEFGKRLEEKLNELNKPTEPVDANLHLDPRMAKLLSFVKEAHLPCGNGVIVIRG